MSVANITTQTAAAIRSANPNSINTLFSDLLKRSSGNTGDVFRRWEGPDGALGYPVQRVTDLSKTAGEIVHFTKHGGLRNKPVLGEATLRGNEKKLSFGTHQVRIDFVRNASAVTRKQIRLMAAGKSVTQAIADELDMWLGGIRTDFIMQRWRQRAVAGHNLYIPNSRGSVGGLTSTDVISTSIIDYAASRLATIGAQPIRNATAKSGATIPKYLFFAPSDVLLPLRSDDIYFQRNIHLEQRGEDNSITEGSYSDWYGNTIFSWNVVDDDSDGPIGSFFNAKAKLGEAIAAGTGVLTIKGGGSGYTASTDYFRHFDGNIAFLQYESESISADTNVYYLKIWNHVASAATGDQGKWGMYSYTGSTGNSGATITTTERLGATASGTRVTTLGNVTYDASKHATDHPVGAPIYQCNANGEVIGYVGALGTGAANIAYGGGAAGDPSASINGGTDFKPSKSGVSGSGRFMEREDYGMIISSAIEAVMGVDVSLDTAGKPRGFVLVPVVFFPPEIGSN